jgi:hypothetical protein
MVVHRPPYYNFFSKQVFLQVDGAKPDAAITSPFSNGADHYPQSPRD